jgi:hypothetical protein
MSNPTPDTGNLATLVFSGGFSARLNNIGELERSIGKLACSALDTEDDAEYVPDDLAETSDLEIEFYFDPAETPPALGEVQTLTVSFPPHPDFSTPAGYTGSGFFMSFTKPGFKNGELAMGKAKFAFDGRGTKFAYTPATPAA